MTAALLLIGAVLVVIPLVDLLWTTVAAGSGAGPLTGRLAGFLWRGSLRVHRRWPSHTFLSAVGVIIVLIVLATWISLILAGWAFTFSAADGAVRDSQTGMPADLDSRLYFVGYTVFTLGNGDYRPGDGLWQMATVLATATGLTLVTLSITYLAPVASAVALRRQLAGYIASLGSHPHEIVTRGWDGMSFGGLSQHLVSLTSLVQMSRQQHLAYPVLHYFHSHDPTNAAATNVTNLAQSLHLLRHGVVPDTRPAAAVLEPLERTLDTFLGTLRSAHLTPEDPLPLPGLEPLRAAGIPTVCDAEYARCGDGTRDRRSLLAGFLTQDGWPTTAGSP